MEIKLLNTWYPKDVVYSTDGEKPVLKVDDRILKEDVDYIWNDDGKAQVSVILFNGAKILLPSD